MLKTRKHKKIKRGGHHLIPILVIIAGIVYLKIEVIF